jgi:alpha-N-arabinofuranosidase
LSCEGRSSPGWLTLRARADALEGPGQPSFIGRRQQHAWATASAAMCYGPLVSGDKVGIVAFQSSDAFYFLGVTLTGGAPAIELEQRSGPHNAAATTVIASAPLETSPDSTLYLRIRARGGSYDFYYAYHPDGWVLLKGDVDGTILSTRIAGGFVGTLLGMYAYHPRP